MKTTACSDVADHVWLTGDEAAAMLAELSSSTLPLHTLIASLRTQVSANRAHLLVEQAELRRRATAKFTRAAQMFFTRVGLEQATDEWVAGYKASKFLERAGASPPPRARRDMPIIADLCCGIGGDLASLHSSAGAVGIDRDPMTAHFAAINSGAEVQTIDVTEFSLKDVAAWHIDPDRRPTGNRTISLDFCEPNLHTLNQLLSKNPNAAVKLAPAATVPADWVEQCELEWISRDRECRQLVAWHGEFAQSPGLRRATLVSTAGTSPRSIVGLPNQPVDDAGSVDRFIFDVDPSVLAAHLKGVLAAEHELSALSAGATYLTGSRPIDDAALACFEVAEVLPLETRKLARLLADRGIGQLEIKKRGLDIDPGKLRRDLKLSGDKSATLLIASVAGRGAAVLARRVTFDAK